MTSKAILSLFATLLIFLPIFGRSINEQNINDYERIVENNVKNTLPMNMDVNIYNKMVRDYWTPERMASAKPLNFLKTQNDFKAESHTPMTIGSERTPRQLDIPGMPPKSLKAAPSVVGKIFGRVDTSNYVCSGSVIVSENGDTVFTAGHCVYDTETKSWASNLIFIPAYENGSTPYDVWVWRTAATLAGWANYANFNYDVAVILLATSDEKQHIQDLTGSLGMTVNKKREAFTDAYGYPVNIKRGEELASCSDGASAADIPQLPDYEGMKLPCNMTGGASGGPWTQEGTYQTSVNSFIIIGQTDVMYGPYFGDTVLNLWEQYQRQ